MKRKLVYIMMAMILTTGVFAGCSNADNEETSSVVSESDRGEYRVAIVTDCGEITDGGYNQAAYDAANEFCQKNKLEFEYFQPTEDTTAARDAAVETAIENRYNVIVMPGQSFAGTIIDLSKVYTDVKFIALDCSESDLREAVAAQDDSQEIEDVKLSDIVYMENVYCADYQEELVGYLGGYAAVKMGYANLGFAYDADTSDAKKYFYGLAQGAEIAAREENVDVTIQCADEDTLKSSNMTVETACDAMYAEGVEVIFAYGNGVLEQVSESADDNNKKVMAVDGQQAVVPDEKDSEVVAAVVEKKYGLAVNDVLQKAVVKGKWDKYLGKVASLGIASADKPEVNYIQLSSTTQYTDRFTEDNYKALVASIYNKEQNISTDPSENISWEKISDIKVWGLNR